jgi:hypothetical protein
MLKVMLQASQSSLMEFEDTPPSQEGHRLQEMRAALEELHCKAVSRLKCHLSEQLLVQEAQLSQDHARQVADLQQEHANQVT